MIFPSMIRIQQHFNAPDPIDPAQSVCEELSKLPLRSRISKGDSVAITVGSRGIANIALIIKTLVEQLKTLGAKPFILPAMGSHGGATVAGQQKIIAHYGVTEDYLGVPIRSTMEVVQVGSIDERIPVYFDKYAYEADHVAVVGRVKPHTEFSGEIESGLYKMMLIGLGNHQGALNYHKAFVHHNFENVLKTVGQEILEKCNILLGLGIVENHYDQTALINAVLPEEMFEREKEMLVLAKRWIPRLPFQAVDLLIIDQMGKEISGSGMDTNVTGRKHFQPHPMSEPGPGVTRIYVRDLTNNSQGNATGIGMADFAHSRLVKKIDHEVTYVNCLTVNSPEAGAIPLHFDTDKKVVEAALKTIGYVEPENARIIHIRNTLDLKEVRISKTYMAEMKQRNDLKIMGPLEPLKFDVLGNMAEI